MYKGNAMQDRYTGDIGDFVKYALLRYLAQDRCLGIAWYLYPDEANGDGRHTNYLSDPAEWRHRDPDLFDELRLIVNDEHDQKPRDVSSIEQSPLFWDVSFSGERLDPNGLTPNERREYRAKWFERVLRDMKECDIVFADPDNGLCLDETFSPGEAKRWKRMPLSEAHRLAERQTAIIYHHNSRFKGGHEAEIDYWVPLLGKSTLAMKYSAYSARTFFIVNPDREIGGRLSTFTELWQPKARLYTFH
jgi:hypothetical protein